MDRCFVEAGGVILDAYGFLGLVKADATDAVDLASSRDGQSNGFGRRDGIPIQNIKLCHGLMIPAVERIFSLRLRVSTASDQSGRVGSSESIVDVDHSYVG